MVHQNFMLVDSFTVAQNIILNRETKQGIRIDIAQAIRDTEALSKEYGLNVNPNARIADIPVGMRQRVEILKALYRGAEILILDEPTAVLTPSETQDLFAAIRNLVEGGKTVVFITHKLKEVIRDFRPRHGDARRPPDRHGEHRQNRRARIGAYDGRPRGLHAG